MFHLKRILLITHNQFGYQTDFFKYSSYLKKEYKLTYLCLDQGRAKIEMEGMKVEYISRIKPNIFWLLSFIFSIVKRIFNDKPDVIIVKYFPLCSFIPMFLKRNNSILSIQSATVTNNKFRNFINDFFIFYAYLSYKYTAVVSSSLKKRLFLQRARILPVGADIIDNSDKSFNSVNLIYVGSLDNRDIHKTIFGIKEFINKHPEINIKYTIIGSGSIATVGLINKAIDNTNLTEIVNYKGYLEQDKLNRAIEEHNVGVSFVPITKYYDKQPPTKTYEYLMSGMPVIATNTFEHRRLINENSGVLIQDTVESFCSGIEKIIQNKNTFSSTKIRNMYSEFNWRNIIELHLKPLICEIFWINEKT